MSNDLEFEFRREFLDYWHNFIKDELGWPDWEQQAELRIKGEVGLGAAKELKRYTELSGKKILDIGAGYSEFLVAAKMQGAIPVGVEPDLRRVRLSRMRFTISEMENTLCIGLGESLPFKDDCFDIVTCLEILEHVRDPASCIMEAVRVLKPGGLLFIYSPNYIYPHEPHYRIFWLPFLPKRLAKIYLRIRGKKPDYIEGINYTTVNSVLKSLKKAGIVSVTNILEDKLQDPYFFKSKRGYLASRVVRAAKVLHISRIVNLLLPHIELLATKS